MNDSHSGVVKVNVNCIAKGFIRQHKYNGQIMENEMGCKCSMNEVDHKGLKVQVGIPAREETPWKTDGLVR